MTLISVDKNRSVEAILVTTGVTTKDVIQIKMKDDNGTRILGLFESYNWVELVRFRSDTILVRLSDSVSLNHIDTQYVKIGG